MSTRLRWRTRHLDECDRRNLFALTIDQYEHPPGTIRLGAEVELLDKALDSKQRHRLWGPWVITVSTDLPQQAEQVLRTDTGEVFLYRVHSLHDPIPSWSNYPFRFSMARSRSFQNNGYWTCTRDKQCCKLRGE